MVILLGAGVSAAAGIPAFRGEHGIHKGDFLGYKIESLFDVNELVCDNLDELELGTHITM